MLLDNLIWSIFMFLDTVKNLEVFRFQDDKSNKVWGAFETEEHVWIVFWCAWKASASFKNHGSGYMGKWSMEGARNGKTKKGYKPVKLSDFVTDWPQFETMMEERFTWFKLQQLSMMDI